MREGEKRGEEERRKIRERRRGGAAGGDGDGRRRSDGRGWRRGSGSLPESPHEDDTVVLIKREGGTKA